MLEIQFQTENATLAHHSSHSMLLLLLTNTNMYLLNICTEEAHIYIYIKSCNLLKMTGDEMKIISSKLRKLILRKRNKTI